VPDEPGAEMQHDTSPNKTNLIPAKAFEFEQSVLQQVPKLIEPPYQVHQRVTDQYGYIAFDANYYWVPGTRRDMITVLQYSDSIRLYHHRERLIEYPLPATGVKKEVFKPKGKAAPSFQPSHHHKSDTEAEEKHLRAISDEVARYLELVLSEKGIQRHRLIRALLGLSKKVSPSLFSKTLQRALQYRITDMNTLERMAILQLAESGVQMPLVELDQEVQNRDAYQKGQFTEPVDWSTYTTLEND
jgi:hypothetical protein